MSIKSNSGVIAAGLALFSMFFGAGDLIWPLILGGTAGSQNFYAMIGLLITGVSLPLLGLIAMMLFQGDYHAFFGQIGRRASIVLIFIIQAILGPIGSIPRLITLSYATLKPYMPSMINLLVFSILACGIFLIFTFRKQKVIDLLGLILTPLLLFSLGLILILGFINPPEPELVTATSSRSFMNGLNVGYNTLDLIASFIFAPLVLGYFKEDTTLDPQLSKKLIFKKMLKSSLIAAGLLSGMYIGLTYISSYYTPLLPEDHAPEERLASISMLLLGPKGALVSCIAVAMACLTTAIPLVAICAEYIQKDLMRNSKNNIVPLLITLGLSSLIANLGFSGIANMLSPILQILCPGLIVLSVLNIFHKLYEIKMGRVPVFAAFAISTIGYLI